MHTIHQRIYSGLGRLLVERRLLKVQISEHTLIFVGGESSRAITSGHRVTLVWDKAAPATDYLVTRDYLVLDWQVDGGQWETNNCLPGNADWQCTEWAAYALGRIVSMMKSKSLVEYVLEIEGEADHPAGA